MVEGDSAAQADPINEAIAASGPPTHGTVDVQLAGGRVARLLVPLPLLAQDVGVIAGILAEVSQQTQAAPPEQAATRSRIWLPGQPT